MRSPMLCIAACAILVLLLAGPKVATAVSCSPSQLAACLSAFTSGTPPTAACCSKLKEQKPCLCGYIKDPNLKQYVTSPNAKKVAATCGVPIPKCN